MKEHPVAPELLLITRQTGLGDKLGGSLSKREFATLEALEAEAPPAEAALVVDASSTPRPAELLKALRQSRAHKFRLIWLYGDADATTRALADGPFHRVDDPGARIADCASRLIVSQAGRRLQSQDDALLALLWSHPELTITAVRDWQAPILYRYPLLDVLLEEGTTEFWLRSLRHRRLLDSQNLVDRVRLCPGCQHAHLSFVDVCPECEALDIRSEPGLHCFSCGHVGPQRLFQEGGMLRCPNCTAVLRHIGEDYDRPMENHVCGSCQHMFMDGHVLARCMACGQPHSPDSLEPLPIQDYRLSEAGRLAARTGELGDLFQVFDDINYITPEYFEFFCDWSLNLRKRHREITFGLVLLRLDNLPALIDHLGHNQAAGLLDGFAERVKALVRTTDLMTRTADDRLWLFLPQTSTEGVRVLADRLQQLQTDVVSNTSLPSLGKVHYEVSSAVSEAEDAAGVMARLTSVSA